ncbi:hypothetical protein EDD80_101235 [Anseongella ginsenosidimutans]|uniref:Membrane or secreted protein n=1 Tax=Anseongella ginsenosidimutans TaxID=496056 RepID=A0A4R3KWA2_9SPHI|nr:hypothetical protein [Anseongella ginsenosidimutans]QEC51274.1 hypothetical protein FRZ59_02180 [Anseongella ginsenosidimutans]TCS90037.1 hypothetical protein EDD80_101235 [Anseongella ginsenosidimutans]
MKRKKTILGGCLLMTVSLIAFTPERKTPAPGDIEGAWEIEGNPKRVALLVDGYFTVTTYKENAPEFISTMGGTFSYDGSAMSGALEFNSEAADQVGANFSIPAKLDGDKLTVTYEDGSSENWTRVDKAEDNLSGVWRITERESEGEMHDIPLRARRTLKILTGTRFQWAAINVETGEFSGTGGGTYTFENGKYTENIEFFSRDNSRVGMSLSFEGDLQNDNWHHKGKSSKGDPIYEVWSRFE